MQRSYKKIHDYGIIGDLHTVAVVGVDGSIDWFCYPHFDSPSVFAAILDTEKGGHFRISANTPSKQLYFPDTNVLITRFLDPNGVGEVTDFMPIDESEGEEGRHRIIRRVTAVLGSVDFELSCYPAFNYGRSKHELKLTKSGALFHNSKMALSLASRIPLVEDGGGVHAKFTLKEGEEACFVLEAAHSVDEAIDPTMEKKEAEKAFRQTVDYWRRWLSKCSYKGRWREVVYRSALLLKLLTSQPTGAIVAAATTSIPEEIGGERNWDYRFTWIRDAAFTIYALMRIGFTGEAYRFMDWLQARISEKGEGESLRPLFTIEGKKDVKEEFLDFEGYEKSTPVRIGNEASDQLQLDVYGALMDAVYLFNKHGTPISHDLWIHLRKMLNWLCDNWDRKDSGIWEVRSGPQHFVYSRMMCWVALDRGIRLAMKRSFPVDLVRWRNVRDTIYEEVMEKGWSEKKQSFVQRYGSDALDASCLLMPLVFFVSPTDPKMLKTIDAIQRELASDNLVHRYSLDDSEDGLSGKEGSFSLCTFWLVEALTRAGRLEEARIIFEKMLSYASPIGIHAEEIGPGGEALGNFPQAFTHLALISAAFNLDRALGSGV